MDWVRRRVAEGLLKPLAEFEAGHRRFSRSRPLPRERRVRPLQTSLTQDKQGRGFVPFAVDIRYGSDWREDIVGCVYRESGKLFVKRGEAYRPAAFLFGKKAAPVAGVCEATPERS